MTGKQTLSVSINSYFRQETYISRQKVGYTKYDMLCSPDFSQIMNTIVDMASYERNCQLDISHGYLDCRIKPCKLIETL